LIPEPVPELVFAVLMGTFLADPEVGVLEPLATLCFSRCASSAFVFRPLVEAPVGAAEALRVEIGDFEERGLFTGSCAGLTDDFEAL